MEKYQWITWVMIDTVAGAEASAMIYSIAETAKVNNLKPYNYFKYLLEEIPRHMDEHGVDFCEEIHPRDIVPISLFHSQCLKYRIFRTGIRYNLK